MENKKRIIPVWLMGILIALIAGNIVICLVNTLEQGSPDIYISSIFTCAACAFAIYYFLGGFGKDSSDMMILFDICYALSYFVLIFSRVKLNNLALLAPPVISYGVMNVMTLAKNVGKKKSYYLCAVLTICFVADLVLHTLNGYYTDLWGTVTGQGILSVAYGIMIYAKYRDKDERGTV